MLEKNWMEKLIKLLNEYDNNWGVTDYWALFNRMNEWINETEDLQVISKKFWFIKRLVEQNKIDDSKVWNSDMLSVQYNVLVNDYKYEWLIMILSISENPISDLISYLK